MDVEFEMETINTAEEKGNVRQFVKLQQGRLTKAGTRFLAMYFKKD